MNFDKHFKETFENHEVNAPKELWDAVDSHFPDDASIFFDKQFADRYSGLKTPPPYKLWLKINSQYFTSSTSSIIKNISWVKLAGIAAAASIIISVIVYISSDNRGLVDIPIENIQMSKSENPKKSNIIDNDSETLSPKSNNRTTLLEELNNATNITDSSPKANESLDAKRNSYYDSEKSNGYQIKGSTIKKSEQKLDIDSKPIKQLLYTKINYTNAHEISKNRKQRYYAETELVESSDITSSANRTRKKERKKKNHFNYGSDDQMKKSNGSINSDKLSLYATIYPSYTYRFLSNSKNNKAEKFYNNYQKGSWSLGGGIYFGYQIKKSWTLKIGVDYSKAVYTTTYKESEKRDDYDVIFLNGYEKSITVLSPFGKATATNLNDFPFGPRPNFENKNDYYPINLMESENLEFLNFPITIEYTFGEKKLKGIAHGGMYVSTNISASSIINITSTKNKDVPVIINNFHNINKVGIGVLLGVGMSYNLSKSININFTPLFRYAISNLVKTNSVKFNPFQFDLSLGVKFNF